MSPRRAGAGARSTPGGLVAFVGVVVAGLAFARPAAGQVAPLGLGPADRLAWAGQVGAADSLLYLAAARAPREPVVRAQLGRWLVARGKVRPGAVLLEEARYFGGDAGTIARDLAPAYERLGDWRALAGLEASPLTAGERQRAEGLHAAPMQVTIPDSTTVALVPIDSGPIGAVVLRVGEASLTARIDPRVRGLVLDTAWRGRAGVEPFAEPTGRPVAGLARRASLGALTWTRLPVRFAPTGGAVEARLGLDVLAAFRPTFDGKRGVVVLRRPVPVRAARSAGVAWPLLETPAGWAIVPPRDSLRPLASGRARAALAGRAWTLEAARGQVTVIYANELLSR
ncbi:MAG: hypothetical protein MUF53_01750 [Gemmatimonadaceae bacterium]|nr:hypothetical protein [Gemmatimonadaceae bacterium]